MVSTKPGLLCALLIKNFGEKMANSLKFILAFLKPENGVKVLQWTQVTRKWDSTKTPFAGNDTKMIFLKFSFSQNFRFKLEEHLKHQLN